MAAFRGGRKFNGDYYILRRAYKSEHEARKWAINSRHQLYRVVKAKNPVVGERGNVYLVYTRG